MSWQKVPKQFHSTLFTEVHEKNQYSFVNKFLMHHVVRRRVDNGVWEALRGGSTMVSNSYNPRRMQELPGVTTAEEAMDVADTLIRMGEL